MLEVLQSYFWPVCSRFCVLVSAEGNGSIIFWLAGSNDGGGGAGFLTRPGFDEKYEKNAA